MTVPTITALPTPPSRTSPSDFATKGDAFLAALPTFVAEANAMAAAMNGGSTPQRMTRRAITGTDTIVVGDLGAQLVLSGTFTLGASAAGTLGAGFWTTLSNVGSSNITLSATVDGVANGTLFPGCTYLLQGDGTALHLFKLAGRITQFYTSGTAWIAPIGVWRGRAKLQGDGGAGGKSGSSQCALDGACGAYCEGDFATVPGNSHAMAIGAGGAAQATTSTAGASGTGTTFNTGATTLTANGGAGGASGTTGITARPTASNGDINIGGDSTGSTGSGTSKGANSQMGVGGRISGGSAVAGSGYGYGGYGATSTDTSGQGGPGCITVEC